MGPINNRRRTGEIAQRRPAKGRSGPATTGENPEVREGDCRRMAHRLLAPRFQVARAEKVSIVRTDTGTTPAREGRPGLSRPKNLLPPLHSECQMHVKAHCLRWSGTAQECGAPNAGVQARRRIRAIFAGAELRPFPTGSEPWHLTVRAAYFTSRKNVAEPLFVTSTLYSPFSVPMGGVLVVHGPARLVACCNA